VTPPTRPRWPGADLPGRRIFVAVPLPADAVATVSELVDRVRDAGLANGGRDVRWVRLDGLHLTLRFIGPTPEERIAAARAALLSAARLAAAFDVTIGEAGTFPEAGRPRALWLGIQDPGEGFADLFRLVDAALVDAGWPPETRPFQPHLTLARADGVPAGRRIGDRLGLEAAGLRIPARIDRIGLFESLTGGGPARYEPIEVAPLG
jgi:2'-5' RNA ligase